MRRFDILAQAVQRAGARKILFGSDGPWLHPGVELAKVRALGLSKQDEALILGGNFLRLIGSVGQSARTQNTYELADFRMTTPVALRAAERGDPWLQEAVH